MPNVQLSFLTIIFNYVMYLNGWVCVHTETLDSLGLELR